MQHQHEQEKNKTAGKRSWYIHSYVTFFFFPKRGIVTGRSCTSWGVVSWAVSAWFSFLRNVSNWRQMNYHRVERKRENDSTSIFPCFSCTFSPLFCLVLGSSPNIYTHMPRIPLSSWSECLGPPVERQGRLWNLDLHLFPLYVWMCVYVRQREWKPGPGKAMDHHAEKEKRKKENESRLTD